MRYRLVATFALPVLLLCSARAQSADEWLEGYRAPAARLIKESLSSTFAWDRLSELTDTFGNRLAGSNNLELAIKWAAERMRADGLDNIRTDPVMVPHWIRGSEYAEIVAPVRSPLVMLGLGNSTGTPADGIEARVLAVASWNDLDKHAADAKGRIVLFNVPFTNYGETVQYRSAGASRAAQYGAVAMLLRSVGPTGLRTPHTGALNYDDLQPKIPAAAISVEDAERLQRMQDRGQAVTVHLYMEAKLLPDSPSANVIGEIRGREHPEQIVVVSGHLDSWDVGAGATDDGGGCVVTWEALRLMKKLNLQPRRTVRVVLWTNEENGLRGGRDYSERYKGQLANHVMMLEADSGVFRPVGFGFTGGDAARRTIERIATLLKETGADQIRPGGGGADIGPSIEFGKMPAMSLNVDGNYFLIHHTPADTIERIDPKDMAKAAAAIAVLSYIVADMPERLDKM